MIANRAVLRFIGCKYEKFICRNSFLDKHMGSVGLAFRVFFKTMFSAEVAQQVRSVLDGEPLPKITRASCELAAEVRPTRQRPWSIMASRRATRDLTQSGAIR